MVQSVHLCCVARDQKEGERTTFVSASGTRMDVQSSGTDCASTDEQDPFHIWPLLSSLTRIRKARLDGVVIDAYFLEQLQRRIAGGLVDVDLRCCIFPTAIPPLLLARDWSQLQRIRVRLRGFHPFHSHTSLLCLVEQCTQLVGVSIYHGRDVTQATADRPVCGALPLNAAIKKLPAFIQQLACRSVPIC